MQFRLSFSQKKTQEKSKKIHTHMRQNPSHQRHIQFTIDKGENKKENNPSHGQLIEIRLLFQSREKIRKGPSARAVFSRKPYNIGLRESFSSSSMTKTSARQALK